MKLIVLLTIVLNSAIIHAQSNVEKNVKEETPATVSPTVTGNALNTNMNSAPASEESIQLVDSVAYGRTKVISDKKAKQLPAKALEAESTGNSSLYKANSSNYGTVYQESTHNNFSRSATPVQQKQMNSSLGLMNTISPDAFETNLYKYVNSRYDSDSASYLFRAAEFQPTNVTLRKQMSGYYIVENKTEQADSITQTLFTDGTYCFGMSNYSLDLSNSIASSNTVIVHGIDDLLPLEQAKNAENQNFDIVSLELLQSDDYRAQLTSRGFIIPASKIVDTAFLVEFVRLNSAKNIQLSMTLPKEYLEKFVPNLYPMGLTFVLQKSSDLNSFNAELWEKEWNQEILRNGTRDWSDNLTRNYLPTLYTLLKYYQDANKTDEVAKIEEIIQAISDRNGVKSKIYGKSAPKTSTKSIPSKKN